MSNARCDIAVICPHFGEEPFISGTKGSGAIFFSGCTMRCVYCQNYQISHEGMGREYREEEVVAGILNLQDLGCHNINLVSPTQYAIQIVKILEIAKTKDLKIPIVYNTNGFDKLSVLKMFDGLVDIYLPDIKYSSDETGYELSGVLGYVERNREAIKEMYRQVGNLEFDQSDIAKKGLLIRHLVLPNDLAGSYESLKFIASLSKEIWISIMSQYNPCYKAKDHSILNRRITRAEYDRVLGWVEDFGFENVLAQELESAGIYNPDFSIEKDIFSPT